MHKNKRPSNGSTTSSQKKLPQQSPPHHHGGSQCGGSGDGANTDLPYDLYAGWGVGVGYEVDRTPQQQYTPAGSGGWGHLSSQETQLHGGKVLLLLCSQVISDLGRIDCHF